MSAKRRIEAAIFDMDGLLIDSEPLWDQAEVEVMESLGVDTRRRDELPDLLGLRIDLVVDLWYAQQPWHGVDRAEATARIIRRAIELVEASRPLLPGVREAVALCKAQGLKVGLASASPLMMLEKVLDMFELRDQFDALASAEHLPRSKPHPQVYPQPCRCPGSRPAALRRAGGFGQRHDRQQSRAHAALSWCRKRRTAATRALRWRTSSFRHCWHSLLRTCSAKTAGGCNNRCHAASNKIKTLFHFNCNFVFLPLCWSQVASSYASRSADRGEYGTERLRPDG